MSHPRENTHVGKGRMGKHDKYIPLTCLFLASFLNQDETQNKLTATEGERVGGRLNEDFGMNRHTRLCGKWTSKELLLDSTGNSTPHLVVTVYGKRM